MISFETQKCLNDSDHRIQECQKHSSDRLRRYRFCCILARFQAGENNSNLSTAHHTFEIILLRLTVRAYRHDSKLRKTVTRKNYTIFKCCVVTERVIVRPDVNGSLSEMWLLTQFDRSLEPELPAGGIRCPRVGGSIAH